MGNRICFREVKKSDYQALEQIINDTWVFESFCSPEIASSMAKFYLASCLSEQTFTCVALNNNEPVGVIMGKNCNAKRLSWRFVLTQLKSVISILSSQEGRKIAAIFREFYRLEHSLLQEAGQDYDGELVFFAVRSDQRGMGIGKGLYTRLMRYFKNEQLCSFYLNTDTTCNIGFYEHQGLEKKAEKKYSLKPYRDQEITFFLYAKQL